MTAKPVKYKAYFAGTATVPIAKHYVDVGWIARELAGDLDGATLRAQCQKKLEVNRRLFKAFDALTTVEDLICRSRTPRRTSAKGSCRCYRRDSLIDSRERYRERNRSKCRADSSSSRRAMKSSSRSRARPSSPSSVGVAALGDRGEARVPSWIRILKP